MTSANPTGVVLQALTTRFDASYRDRDPVGFAHRYERKADREAAALLAATCAFGGVKAILGSLELLFARLGPKPAETIDGLSTRAAAERLVRGLKHRWFATKEFASLLRFVRAARSEHGSIERAFRRGDDPSAPDVGPGLAAFSEMAARVSDRPLDRAARFMFPSPEGGAACKRMNLFLRWCARKDDGLDLGLWRTPTPDRLVVPLDVHVAFHARVLGFTNRRQADWKAALETTAALRAFDPADPIRFDFALCHLGIHGACIGRRSQAICPSCPLDALCRLPRARAKTRTAVG